MADTGLLRLLFLSANLVFWLVGAGLLGFVGWTLSTLPNTSGFMSGSFLILYAGIIIGVLISLDGLIGCLGGMFGSMLLIRIYLGLSVFFGILEVGIILAVYVQNDKIPSILESTWNEINDDARYTIQKSLQCCGISSYTEYGIDIAEYPDTCFRVSQIFGTVIEKQQSTLYTTSCLSAMQTWLKENMAIWISVLVVMFVIQTISGMLSCQVHTRLHEKVRIAPVNEEDPGLETSDKTDESKLEVNEDDKNIDETGSDRDTCIVGGIVADRNMDGASCKSNTTLEVDHHKDQKKEIVDIVNLDNESSSDSDSNEEIEDEDENQFRYTSEPKLNETDLENVLLVKDDHFSHQERTNDGEEINCIKNEENDVQDKEEIYVQDEEKSDVKDEEKSDVKDKEEIDVIDEEKKKNGVKDKEKNNVKDEEKNNVQDEETNDVKDEEKSDVKDEISNDKCDETIVVNEEMPDNDCDENVTDNTMDNEIDKEESDEKDTEDTKDNKIFKKNDIDTSSYVIEQSDSGENDQTQKL